MVSSHLLSEVEQTCSHVVVMHQGKVILTGVDGRADRRPTTSRCSAWPSRPTGRARWRCWPDSGIQTRVDPSLGDRDGLIRAQGPVPRPALVAALVEAGIAVDFVDGRRQLEEVFMTLVGPGGITEPGASADD